MKIKEILPVFEWLPTYDKAIFKGDLWAGITVGIMLIPQGMAYAMIAGLPPIYGLYAAFVPQIIYSIFGTSRQLSVAPVAMISLLIGAGISEFAAQGSDAYVKLAILLAMIVGLLQLLFGLFKMGFLVNFLSQPVISGYTSSAAIIIGLSQLKHLLGIDVPSSNLIHEIFGNLASDINKSHFPTIGLGLAGIVIIFMIRKINKSIPGPLIIVVLAIAAVYAFGLEKAGVKIVGPVPEGLPSFILPEISVAEISRLLPLALLISLVGFMESISISKAIQSKKRNYRVSANKELIGLGIANFTGSLFGSFPVSGGFSRTAINEQAGANTNLSSWISAVIVGLTLLFFTSFFYSLPKAVLASIIMVAVFGLIDVKSAVLLFKTNKKDFAMLLVTFLSTLVFGVQIGILTGVVLSLGLVIHRSVYPHLAELGKLPDTNYYRNLSRFPEAQERRDALVFRFDSELYFANINYFRDRLEQMIERKGDDLRVIVLNAQSIYALDSSAAKGLEEIVDDCRMRKIEFYMTEVIGPVRDTLRKTGLFEKIGEDHFRMRVQDALDYFDTHEMPKHAYAIQANQ
ncbi:MAG: solute carrier family 26 protein [Cytophagales bacterium]|nr:solute carrier family 26 protein [Cytophagales bacterium]